MTSTLTKTPTTKAGFELEEIDGELLLYSPSSTRSVYMNSTASIIWRLCDGNQTVQDIVTLLQEAFPEAKDSIEQDVVDSINLFAENGAIELI
ncbi:MAG: PqqD family protein [Pseudomonadota bacterium]